MNIDQLDTFTKHYLIAALFTDSEQLLFDNTDGRVFDLNDFAPEFIARSYAECQAFQHQARGFLPFTYQEYIDKGNADHPDAGSPEACAGHDFWLSRNGHGCGFWDRGLVYGEQLHRYARDMKEVDLYIGDDGQIYGA